MKRRFAALFAIAALTLSLGACSSAEKKLSVDYSGDIPKIVFPKSDAPKDLQVTVLEEGKGREIAKDDFVNVDYVGAVWGSNTPFDSSFSRSQTLAISLTELISGWSKGLEGHHVGDKLILSIPPEYGYGEMGNEGAGIKGTDTIVFYIEVHDAWPSNATGQKDATVELEGADLPIEMDGGVGEPLTFLSVKKGTPEPTENTTRVIARGTGKEIAVGDTIYYQFIQTYWDNSSSTTSWKKDGVEYGIQSISVAAGSPLEGFAGIPVGSRVLLEVPKEEGAQAAGPASAIVIDIIGIDSQK